MSTRTFCTLGVALLVALMLMAGCTPKNTDSDPMPPGSIPEPSDMPAAGEPTDGAAGEGDDASPTSRMMDSFDKDGDGQLTKDEMGEEMWGHVARVDADEDGVLTGDEIGNLRMGGTIDGGAMGGGMGGMGGGMGAGHGTGTGDTGDATGSPHGPDMSKMQSGHGSGDGDEADDAEPTTE